MNELNGFDNEYWCNAKALKREGAEYDGQLVSVKEKEIIRCVKCRHASTPLYGKKYGVFLHNRYFCDNCRTNIGKCFICQITFESDKDLGNVHPTQVECKDCKQ